MSGLRWLRRRSRRQVLADVLVLAGLVLFVVLVYVVLVLGGGVLIGHTSSPDVALSVLATVVVALAFDPVQTRLERVAVRLVHDGQPAPYDVLRTFSRTVAASYDAQELPERMARVLADGTRAEWAQVWLAVGGTEHLAATWPPASPEVALSVTSESGRGLRSLPVLEAGELLGRLVVLEREHRPLSSVEARLFAGLAAQAGPVLRGTRLTAELNRRAVQMSDRAAELRTSRQRLVEAHDTERRHLERNIHDGAQQHLVALAVNLRLAETLSIRSSQRAEALLAQQELAAAEAIAVLVALSRGIYPPTLGAEGLLVAVRDSVGTSVVPVEVVATNLGRYSSDLEATAYFCCLEAVQNAAKHSGAATIRVSLTGQDTALGFVVEDDGVGFDPARTPDGTGLANLRDRVESADGTFTMETGLGAGTRIRASLPVRTASPPATMISGD
jgi:signal transduction histidine kinase